MDKEEKRPETAPAEAREPQKTPKLSAQFYLNLLNPPLCKVTGECDGCGRCEH